MSDLLVRWATRWDRQALVELLLQRAAEEAIETGADVLAAALDHALGAPAQFRFAVAASGHRVVGVASLQQAYSAWLGGPYGLIGNLCLAPEAEAAEVGRGLLAMLLEEARRRGYERVEARAQEEDDPMDLRNTLGGERYHALVPDTLDLAQRAAVALNALTRRYNPEFDYENYEAAYFYARPPYMEFRHGAFLINAKLAESFPMMRIIEWQ